MRSDNRSKSEWYPAASTSCASRTAKELADDLDYEAARVATFPLRPLQARSQLRPSQLLGHFLYYAPSRFEHATHHAAPPPQVSCQLRRARWGVPGAFCTDLPEILARPQAIFAGLPDAIRQGMGVRRGPLLARPPARGECSAAGPKPEEQLDRAARLRSPLCKSHTPCKQK